MGRAGYTEDKAVSASMRRRYGALMMRFTHFCLHLGLLLSGPAAVDTALVEFWNVGDSIIIIIIIIMRSGKRVAGYKMQAR